MSQQKQFSNVNEIRQVINEPVVIEVAGLRLELKPIEAAAALQIRHELIERLKDASEGGSLLLVASQKAVQACLRMPLSEEEVARLIMRCGGEQGKLARAATNLCGLNHLFADTSQDQETADPTPFSLPGKRGAA